LRRLPNLESRSTEKYYIKVKEWYNVYLFRKKYNF
jgi:hypothetical protein